MPEPTCADRPQEQPARRPANRVLVLFGATGDLAARKLLPGLFRLFQLGLMPERFAIIGSGRHAPDDFTGLVAKALDVDPDDGGEEWERFAATLSFVVSSAEDGADLAEAIIRAEAEIDADGDRLVYLSVPPKAAPDMVAMLGRTGIAPGCALVVEKPFGHDLASAKAFNATLHEVLPEEAIYRIDHFLGKEPVQNLLALRFANGIFEPIWNRDHITSVQIDVPEALDIEGRAGFYEQTGAFRDMVVTHLLQILAVVALEPPSRIDPEALHRERTKVFESLVRLDAGRAVFGQYDGYRDSDGVADDSQVETFVALEARIDTWRWAGVPFYLRTGKALAEGRRTVTIAFRPAPLRVFGGAAPDGSTRPSELVLELSDDPRAAIHVQAKVPGPGLRLGPAAFTLDVGADFRQDGFEAYARLLHDVMTGDRLLFTRSEQIEALWAAAQPLLDAPPPLVSYPRGSWGPQEAQALVPAPGWRLPEADIAGLS
ncbi:glucose-6-phosphate dehydrogenase [Conexibacter sp. DBS9H8]|uniref:glucose-6-phosphate dehydrogenase n=1 Tax=Conexibacter sp. DBS9H8 TaxID=2937801 RepID=UPI00200E6019|nr:glucose-6-phosphate dehydrogenase [Conexibacter sp. DBS9H8]